MFAIPLPISQFIPGKFYKVTRALINGAPECVQLRSAAYVCDSGCRILIDVYNHSYHCNQTGMEISGWQWQLLSKDEVTLFFLEN